MRLNDFNGFIKSYFESSGNTHIDGASFEEEEIIYLRSSRIFLKLYFSFLMSKNLPIPFIIALIRTFRSPCIALA